MRQLDVVKHLLHIEVLHARVVEVASVPAVLAGDAAGRPSRVAAECLCVGVDAVGQEWDELCCDGNQDGLGGAR